MIQVKRELLAALGQALNAVAPDAPAATPVFEAPKQAAHGDLAVTAAMQLAKALKKNPRELGQALADALQQQPAVQRWVQLPIEIAGPGFINLRLKPEAKQAVVGEVLAQAERFGFQPAQSRKVLAEFVSANPTGPLHVGHGRQGALGDALCNLFETQGQQVTREFYYNDAGVQIDTLTHSTQLRIKGFKPGDDCWPTDPENPESKKFYNGDYIADIAADFLAKKTVKADDREFTASGDPDDQDSIRQFAVAYLRHEQDLDLQAFGVRFDNYYLESSLYTSGRVESAVQKLKDAGKTFEEGGALWLRSTDYGDDKDRVMKKSDGGYTYFVPDVAYHIAKWERGFEQVVNIQGSDHHGTIARVRAGLQAAGVGIPQGWPDYVLHKMVTVMKNGEEVKISKRAGSYVTLRDLIGWTSRDAVRFFLISRKADTEFTFDVDLARKTNDENPVFYVQYAHARICSVQRQYVDEELGWPKIKAENVDRFRKELLGWICTGLNNGRFAWKKSAVLLSRLLANSTASFPEDGSFKSRSRKLFDSILNGSHFSFSFLEKIIESLPLNSKHVRKLTHKLVRMNIPPQSLIECIEVTESINSAYVGLVFRKFVHPRLENAPISRLTSPTELALMNKLAHYPEMLTQAAQGLAPHDVAFYLRELAGAFHSYYAAERFLVDDGELSRARIALLTATAQVLRNGLSVLGVSAPEAM